MASVVVDTSAVIAAILGESGAEAVGRKIGQAMMSAVNFQEAEGLVVVTDESGIGDSRHRLPPA